MLHECSVYRVYLSSLRVTKVNEIVVSLCEQWWDIPLTDEVGVWDPLHSNIPGRKLHFVFEAQFAGYLLGLANSPLCGTWASSDNVHGVIKNTVNEASVSTPTPDWCAVLIEYIRDRAAFRSVFVSAPYPHPESFRVCTLSSTVRRAVSSIFA